ncbi:MAG TPA: OB-fold domain-containing protein, partial [Deltaproteobacteria bacterium]|nr:OB-fold domain-containing protein [Deltaproteobacteria bacterium]
PYTYGYIRLDGADSIFSHIINETDLSKIKVGMRVRAVFKDKKDMQGNIQDILHFEIIG